MEDEAAAAGVVEGHDIEKGTHDGDFTVFGGTEADGVGNEPEGMVNCEGTAVGGFAVQQVASIVAKEAVRG